jgi:hypothetical protein
MGVWFDFYMVESSPTVRKAWSYLVARADTSGVAPRGVVEDDTVTELEHMTLLIQMGNGNLWLNPTHSGKGDPSAWDEAFLAKARESLKKAIAFTRPRRRM